MPRTASHCSRSRSRTGAADPLGMQVKSARATRRAYQRRTYARKVGPFPQSSSSKSHEYIRSTRPILRGRRPRDTPNTSCFMPQGRCQFSRLRHLLHDVQPADQLAIRVELRVLCIRPRARGAVQCIIGIGGRALSATHGLRRRKVPVENMDGLSALHQHPLPH